MRSINPAPSIDEHGKGDSSQKHADFSSLWKKALQAAITSAPQNGELPGLKNDGNLLFNTILKMVFKRFVFIVFLKTAVDSLGFLTPYFIKSLVKFLKSEPTDNSILPLSYVFTQILGIDLSNTKMLMIHLLFFFAFDLAIRSLQRGAHYKMKSFTIHLDASLKQEIFHSIVKTPLYLRKDQNLDFGTLMERLEVDCKVVSQFFEKVTDIISSVFSLLVIFFFLSNLLNGITVLLLFCSLAFVLYFHRKFLKKLVKPYSQLSSQWANKRLTVLDQFLVGLKFLHLHGWENAYIDKMEHIRDEEISARVYKNSRKILSRIFLSANTVLIPLFGLGVYYNFFFNPDRTKESSEGTQWEVFVATVGFLCASYLKKLRKPLKILSSGNGLLIQTRTSLMRLEGIFMLPKSGLKAKNLEKDEKTSQNEAKTFSVIAENAVLDIESKEETVAKSTLSCKIPKGKLTVILGEIGKSTLLKAICGELRVDSGKLSVFGSVSYCPQIPIIESNISLRDNITFGAPFDKERYQAVLGSCQLNWDLENFPSFSEKGDLTILSQGPSELNKDDKEKDKTNKKDKKEKKKDKNEKKDEDKEGKKDKKKKLEKKAKKLLSKSADEEEKGKERQEYTYLSGGQQNRVNLARACYLDRDMYLLDDALNGLDEQVSENVFSDCILTTLSNKTRIMTFSSYLSFWKFRNHVDHVIYISPSLASQKGVENNIVFEGPTAEFSQFLLTIQTTKNDDKLSRRKSLNVLLNTLEAASPDSPLSETEYLSDSAFETKNEKVAMTRQEQEDKIQRLLNPQVSPVSTPSSSPIPSTILSSSPSFVPEKGKEKEKDKKKGKDSKEKDNKKKKLDTLSTLKIYLSFFNWKWLPVLIILFGLKNILSIKGNYHVSGTLSSEKNKQIETSNNPPISKEKSSKLSIFQRIFLFQFSFMKKTSSSKTFTSFFLTGLFFVVSEGIFMYLGEYVLSWLQLDVSKKIHHQAMIQSFGTDEDKKKGKNCSENSSSGKIFHLFSKDIKRVDNFAAFKKTVSQFFSVVTSIIFLCGISISYGKSGITWMNGFFIWVFLQFLFFLEPRKQLKDIHKKEVEKSSQFLEFFAILFSKNSLVALRNAHKSKRKQVKDNFKNKLCADLIDIKLEKLRIGSSGSIDSRSNFLNKCLIYGTFFVCWLWKFWGYTKSKNAAVLCMEVLQVVDILDGFLKMFMACEVQMNSIERVCALFSDTAAKIEQNEENSAELPQILDYSDSKKGLIIEDLSVSYDNSNSEHHINQTAIFQHFSLELPPKSKKLLVGRTGSGKTTLFNTLLRWTNIVAGNIYLDGKDLMHVPLWKLRKEMVCYIPQFSDYVIFSELSVRDNIDPFGTHTDTEILEVLKIFDLGKVFCGNEEQNYTKSDFLDMEMKKFELSQGDVQLFSFSSMLLQYTEFKKTQSNASILVPRPNLKLVLLDEFTSSLDEETEAKVLKKTLDIFKDVIVIAINHRSNVIASISANVDEKENHSYFDEIIRISSNSSISCKLDTFLDSQPLESPSIFLTSPSSD